ncbi:MAG: thioesterase family protein [Proteobacteria bacterium]|nr:thioesterase family protein [Pseudomonadota bacterium]
MHPFDQDLAIEQTDLNLFSMNVSDNWLINKVSNGGYLMAALARAMMGRTEKEKAPVLTANYIYRTIPGPARISVESFAQSKSFDRLEARLSQNGRECVRAWGTFRDGDLGCDFIRHEADSLEIPPPDQCVSIPEMPGYTLFRHADVRLDPACAGWMTGKPNTKKSEQRGWIAFREPRPWDLFSVALATDAFPPAIMASQGMLAWVPTLELSISIRKIPTTPRLKCAFTSRHMDCGILEEDGQIWDEQNNLIALSRQTAQFRV